VSKSQFQTQIELLLNGLGTRTGTSNLALNEEGRCVIGESGDHVIDLFFDGGEDEAFITIATIINELEHADPTSFLTEALRANFYWRGTQGATLSLGPEDHVLLHRQIPLEENFELQDLIQAIDSFIDVTKAWAVFLERQQPVMPDMA